MSIKESKYFNDKQDKIELVGNCLLGDKYLCKKQLSVINKKFLASSRYFRDKDYTRSIEELKSAFYITTEIQETSCTKCIELFRSTITESLENIHADLQKMSTGFFVRKHYQSSYELATSVLGELKKVI